MNWWNETQGSIQNHLANLRVAVYASGGAPSHHIGLLALWGGNPQPIHAEDIAKGNLKNYDVVIFPGGGLFAMAGQLNPLGTEGVAQIRQWIQAGGTYIGSCAGSCHPLKMGKAYQKAQPLSSQFQMCNVTPVNAAIGEWGMDSPGTGRLKVASEDHPLFEGMGKTFEVVHYNGPLYPAEPGAGGMVLSATKHFTPFEVTLGTNTGSTTIERAIAQEARIAYRQIVGKGQIMLFGSHPEFGSSALQLGWIKAARLLANALCLVPVRKSPKPPKPKKLKATTIESIHNQASELRELLNSMTGLGKHLPASTPPFLGYKPSALWKAALQESDEILSGLEAWSSKLSGGEYQDVFLLDAAPKTNQDFGFAGVRQMLAKALEMTRKAQSLPPSRWPAFSGPYNEFLDHPYHLVASVYLSAGGLIAGAGLQATAFAAVNHLPEPNIVPITA